ncbi:pyridoxamine 5'-phosphate oxidase family protein [Winogradskya consettensis]|uniref:Phosphohydrolase n=1 Tax=Winogradskya consettensis TaxID=113560 RepID=A0A919SEC1_9ACTN|nr:MSMEG_1061 family FMN-dependent PPOX-type flavoprotein [Actinoplanes consettensis]GIM69107.1 phosphohydrolase [Actinoplanes consettensis]
MRITTEEQLREVIDHPHPELRDKAITVIDEESARFLSAATFFLLATTAADGTVDVSPRGETPGAITVLDEKRLAFGDRPGNRRLDSFRNILQCPQIGMLFIVPGRDETLRVNGHASLHRDPDFTDAPLGVILEVDELFLHCGQSFRRGSVWDQSGWPSPATVPSFGAMIKSTGAARVRLAQLALAGADDAVRD